jgi:hypothetical protein
MALLTALTLTTVMAEERGESTSKTITPGPTITPAEFAYAMEIAPGDLSAVTFDGSDPVAFGVSDAPVGAYFPRQGNTFAMMSTGRAIDATQDQEVNASTGLTGLNNSRNEDLARIRMTLTAPLAAQCFAFDFAFFSEEYPEYTSGLFADVFTAEKGGTNITIVGTTVTAPLNFAFTQDGGLVSVTEDLGFSPNTGNVYGGVTALLTAKTQVTGGETFELVFSIQDIGDSIYDSAVFLDRARWTADSACAGGALETGSVAGQIINAQNFLPVPGAIVQFCLDPAIIGPCPTIISGANGEYSFTGQSEGHYKISAFPPAGSNLRTSSTDPFDLDSGQDISGKDLFLPLPQGLPEGFSLDPIITIHPGNVPVIPTNKTVRVSIPGCPNGGGSATFAIPSLGYGPFAMSFDPITGTFFHDIPPLAPHHGNHPFVIKRFCPDPNDNLDVTVDVYIDPSGYVKTTTGIPIVGATVILYRSESPGGPFVQVPDGSAIMSPSNRDNPDLTNATGHFGWDVIAGYYKVQASHPECHKPGDAGTLFVETGVLTIPPPVFDLDLRLQCGEFDPIDANCSFDIDALDIVYLLEVLSGLEDLVPSCNADPNGDQVMDLLDPHYVRQWLAGLIQ